MMLGKILSNKKHSFLCKIRSGVRSISTSRAMICFLNNDLRLFLRYYVSVSLGMLIVRVCINK